MKIINLKHSHSIYRILIVALFSIAISGCKTDSTSATPAPVNPYGDGNGQETIWASNTTISKYPITVSVGGVYVGTIGGLLSATPDCGKANDRVVKFIGAPGTYNMVGTASSSGTWTGTFTIKEGICNTLELKN